MSELIRGINIIVNARQHSAVLSFTKSLSHTDSLIVNKLYDKQY